MSATTTMPRPGPSAPTAPGRGSSRRGRRVVAIEARRGVARPLALGITALAAVLLVLNLLPAAGGSWGSSWTSAVDWTNDKGRLWSVLVATAGAWTGGRERRSATGELLAVTSRPPAHRVLLHWAVLAAGVLAGFVGQTTLLAAAVLPGVSYSGGRWAATLGVQATMLLLLATAGFAVGRLVPGRLVAPAVGVAELLGETVVDSLHGPGASVAAGLWPSGGVHLEDGFQLTAYSLAGLASWFLALTGAALVLAVARRRAWVALPLAAAVVAALALVASPSVGGAGSGPWSQVDAAAQAPVCSPGAGPRVCVTRVHAGLLEAITPVVRQQLTSVADLVDLTGAQEGGITSAAPPPGVVELFSLEGAYRPFSSALGDPARFRANVLSDVAFTAQIGCGTDSGAAATALSADTAASALLHRSPGRAADDQAARATYERVAGDPAAARTWFTAYLAAGRSCDLPALQQLVRR